MLQLRGTSQYALKKAHEQYGDVVRIGPSTLSIINASAWNDICGYRDGRAVLPKSPQLYNEMVLDKHSITLASDIRERHRRYDEVFLQRVRSRMNTEMMGPDFMYHFVRHAKKEGLSTRVIEAQASVVILAGSETSSVALTGAVYHVLRNLHVYERLCKEIRGAFTTVEDIALQNVLSKLPYLDAVVQETLRIHTPLPNGFTRVVPDAKGAMTSGYWVPQGATFFRCPSSPPILRHSSHLPGHFGNYCSIILNHPDGRYHQPLLL